MVQKSKHEEDAQRTHCALTGTTARPWAPFPPFPEPLALSPSGQADEGQKSVCTQLAPVTLLPSGGSTDSLPHVADALSRRRPWSPAGRLSHLHCSTGCGSAGWPNRSPSRPLCLSAVTPRPWSVTTLCPLGRGAALSEASPRNGATGSKGKYLHNFVRGCCPLLPGVVCLSLSPSCEDRACFPRLVSQAQPQF